METYKDIIEGCINNDRLWQEKLYRAFYPQLIQMCKRFFDDDHDAIEALNNGMLKVYRNIRFYDETKGSFFTWIYSIVRNAALDKLKLKKYRGSEELNGSFYESSAPHALTELERNDICKLLNSLAPYPRVICNLFYFEGFSIAEISEKLKLQKGTVKWHLHDIRKKLKPVFEKHYS